MINLKSAIKFFLAPLVFPGLLSAQSHEELVSLSRALRESRRSFERAVPPDFSISAVMNARSTVESMRQRLSGIDPGSWAIPMQVDYWVVRAELEDWDFELRVKRPWQRDPGFWVDKVASLPFAELPTDENELAALKIRIEQVPALLVAARERLDEVGGEFAGLALRNLQQADGVGHGHPWRPVPPAGVIGWYEDLLGRAREQSPTLIPAIEEALRGLRTFRGWLEHDGPNFAGSSGVGLADYQEYIWKVRLMPFTVAQILEAGERELERARADLAIERNRNRDLPALEPAHSQEEYERRIREADRDIRNFIQQKRIISIPDFVGDFDTNVPWLERASGKLNFWESVQYRDPRPDHVHAVIPGHRFDALLNSRDFRPIRSGYSDSGRVEGWGFYLEEMMMRAGLLDNRPRTRELFHIFSAARAVRNRAEVLLHSGEFSIDQAVQYMVENVPYMDEDVARVDCEIYLKRPGYGASYLMGKLQITALLGEVSTRDGQSFQLQRFHDRFLESGWIPVSLIRWEMTGWSDEVDRLRMKWK